MANVIKLSNGITVVTEPLPFFRTASAGIYVNAGSAFENKSNQGISHLFEHMAFKGTATRTAAEIADETVRLGDDINAYTSKEFTVFYGTTLGSMLKRMLSLFADMLQNSVFDLQELEKEKQIVSEEIAMYEDSPEDIVHDRIQESVFKDHPLGYIISGDEKTVRAVSREDLLTFKDTFYTGENIIISVAGNFPEDIVEFIENEFGGIKRGSSNLGLLTAPVYTRSVINVEKNIDLYHINLAIPSICSNSPEQYAAAVFHSAFGGSNNSVLFRTIREELGLAYSVYSYNSTFKTAGLTQIDVTVDGKDAVKTVDEIVKIAENIKRNGFDPGQVGYCREQAVIELVMGSESAGDRMSLNARQLLAYGKLIDIDEQARLLEAVTLEDIGAFARKYLDIPKLSVCVVGKRAKRIANEIRSGILTT
ncbi:MAG: insulinase family protein [Lachnospiraceae bacterium]|nr:insulinase family protein [Lachnospiraceae bacterium]